MRSMTQKLYNYLGWPTKGGWNCTESIALNMKLWPQLKTNRWPSYWVMNMYNITGTCQFHRSVANCDKRFTYKGAKIHRFYCIFITIKVWLMPYWNSFTFIYGQKKKIVMCNFYMREICSTAKRQFWQSLEIHCHHNKTSIFLLMTTSLQWGMSHHLNRLLTLNR